MRRKSRCRQKTCARGRIRRATELLSKKGAKSPYDAVIVDETHAKYTCILLTSSMTIRHSSWSTSSDSLIMPAPLTERRRQLVQVREPVFSKVMWTGKR